MRRAQDDRVCARVEHRAHVTLEHESHLGSVEVGLLDVLDKTRHRLNDHLHIAAEPVEQRREAVGLTHGGRDDRAHHARPGRPDGRFDPGLDADDRDRQ
jgi:hypothetical protein